MELIAQENLNFKNKLKRFKKDLKDHKEIEHELARRSAFCQRII